MTEDIIKDRKNFDNDKWAVHKVVERSLAIVSAITYVVVAVMTASCSASNTEVLTIVSYVFIASTLIYILGVRSLQTIAETIIKTKLGVDVELVEKKSRGD